MSNKNKTNNFSLINTFIFDIAVIPRNSKNHSEYAPKIYSRKNAEIGVFNCLLLISVIMLHNIVPSL